MSKKLGLIGVFLPNVLTIIGLILYLRLSWVVQTAGLLHTLIIIGIATSISLFTALSLSVISTSMRMGSGGSYYIISRSLGPEIGGALGLTLYVSQAISVAFYIIGCAEALATLLPQSSVLIAFVLLLIMLLVSIIGSQYLFMLQGIGFPVMIIAVLSFFIGGWSSIQPPLLFGTYGTHNIWSVFSIFFPAVTGFTVGVSLSGMLKNPTKDIPRGTLLAIGFTTIIYVLAAVWFSFHPQQLSTPIPMAAISIAPWLIMVGIITSTLTAALGSLLAAPQTLAALAKDAILPSFLYNDQKESVYAILVTISLASIILMLGNVNVIAPIISMFFLNTYAILNGIVLVEKFVSNPNYRPRIHLHWTIPAIGFLGCIAAMFLINKIATLVAAAVNIAIYLYLKKRSLTATYGDSRAGWWSNITQFSLQKIRVQDTKNWRPNIIIFYDQHNLDSLLHISKYLLLGKGFVSIIGIVPQKLIAQRSAMLVHLKSTLQKRKLACFAEIEISDSPQAPLLISQSHGIGNLEPNTVIFPLDKKNIDLSQTITTLNKLGKSVVLWHQKGSIEKLTSIDIWSRGEGNNIKLMLLFAHIMAINNNVAIRIVTRVGSKKRAITTQQVLNSILEEMRINATIKIIISHTPMKNLIVDECSKSTLVMISMRRKEINDDFLNYAKTLSNSLNAIMLMSGAGIEKIVDL